MAINLISDDYIMSKNTRIKYTIVFKFMYVMKYYI